MRAPRPLPRDSRTDSSKSTQYSNESYDYPPNLRESFTDLGRSIGDKVQLLSAAARSPENATEVLSQPPPNSAKPQPKTFSHAVARAALASSASLNDATFRDSGKQDPLAVALEKYALACERVGEARLGQDAQIQSRFLAGWSTTLNTNLQFATRARRAVESARLGLDATRAGRADGANLTEAQRAEVEKKEDEFVAQTEEAEGVMKNVRLLLRLRESNADIHIRSWTHLSRCAIYRSSLPPSLNTTSARRRFWRSSHRPSRRCRKSRRCAALLYICEKRSLTWTYLCRLNTVPSEEMLEAFRDRASCHDGGRQCQDKTRQDVVVQGANSIGKTH